MKILEKPIGRGELRECQVIFDDVMVKAVVDIDKEILAIDAEMHADLERFLLENGSDQDALWGINLYFDEDEDLVEFDSMINVRPRQNNRSRGVEDATRRDRIVEVVGKWIS